MSNQKINNINFIVLKAAIISLFLTGFYYVHEYFPKPIRAITAMLEAPVAIVSGFCHYVGIKADVYGSIIIVIIANFLFSLAFVFILGKIRK
jgi:hypothetical protein